MFACSPYTREQCSLMFACSPKMFAFEEMSKCDGGNDSPLGVAAAAALAKMAGAVSLLNIARPPAPLLACPAFPGVTGD
jgi:hypothetical protein